MRFEEEFYREIEERKVQKSEVTENAIPISADVCKLDFNKLIQTQKRLTGKLFDVIMMDPPWQLSTSQPSRGVAIAYDSLADDIIESLPITKLQTAGFIFIWVINAKYSKTCAFLKKWG